MIDKPKVTTPVVSCPSCGNDGAVHMIRLIDHPERMWRLDPVASEVLGSPVWSGRTHSDDGGLDALWCEKCGNEWAHDSAATDDVFLD